MPAAVTIQHQIDAGSQFNGALPATTPTENTDTGVKAFPSGTVGGRFVFDFTNVWLMEIHRIIVAAADAATVNIRIVTAGGLSYLLYTGATPGTVIITDLIKLAADERIEVETIGASLAMSARVTGRPIMSKPA